MYPIQINTWYNCVPDPATGRVELCKICSFTDSKTGLKQWHIVTYYDGKECLCDTLNECLHWINKHYTKERRYFN